MYSASLRLNGSSGFLMQKASSDQKRQVSSGIDKPPQPPIYWP